MITFEYAPGVVAELHVEHLGFDLVGKAETWSLYDMKLDSMVPFAAVGMELGRRPTSAPPGGTCASRGMTSGEYLAGRNLGRGIWLFNLSGTHIITGCRHRDRVGRQRLRRIHGRGQDTGGGSAPGRQGNRQGYRDDRDPCQRVLQLRGHDLQRAGQRCGMGCLLGVGAEQQQGVYERCGNLRRFRSRRSVPAAGGAPSTPSTYLFEHNTIRQTPGTTWAGFEIHETGPVKSHIVIRNNHISGQDSFVWGPIFAVGAQNAVISNNTDHRQRPGGHVPGPAHGGLPDDQLTTT